MNFHTEKVRAHQQKPIGSGQISALIRQKIESGGERLWRVSDFSDLPAMATAQALSRAVRQRELQRLSKGIYYRSRNTMLGESRPNPSLLQSIAGRTKVIFPSGVAAANHLGFSTQTSKHTEMATTALSLPRKLIGDDAIVHTRRPESWKQLSTTDAALLDFLRQGGKTSELSDKKTICRTLELISEKDRLDRLLDIAGSEPPRVRAILGAIAQELGKESASLHVLRESLNPLSRFDFGMFAALEHAYAWQAKEAGR